MMLSELEREAIPRCAPSECFESASFAEAVYMVKIELDLIEEGQDAAAHYTKREITQLRKFVNSNRASLGSMSK